MSQVCKTVENGRLTVDQKVKVVLFNAEIKSVVATQRRFRAHFGTRWASCKQTIYRLSLGTIFQAMRINYVPDVKYFLKNKNVLCVQSMVWHFVRRPVLIRKPSIKATFTLYITVLCAAVAPVGVIIFVFCEVEAEKAKCRKTGWSWN